MNLDEANGPVHLLAKQLRAQYVKYELPGHVARRLAYVLAGRAASYIDVHLWDDEGETSGVVVAFTSDLVAVARVSGVSGRSLEAGNVSVSVAARASLKMIELMPQDELSRNRNSDWVVNQYADGWPSGGAVSLVYSGMDDPVIIPNNDRSRQEFEQLLDKLLDDLAG